MDYSECIGAEIKVELIYVAEYVERQWLMCGCDTEAFVRTVSIVGKSLDTNLTEYKQLDLESMMAGSSRDLPFSMPAWQSRIRTRDPL